MIGFIISLLVLTTLPIFIAGMLAWAAGLNIMSEKAHIAVHWAFIMRYVCACVLCVCACVCVYCVCVFESVRVCVCTVCACVRVYCVCVFESV